MIEVSIINSNSIYNIKHWAPFSHLNSSTFPLSCMIFYHCSLQISHSCFLQQEKKNLFLLTTHKIFYCNKQSCLLQANAERWTWWNCEISILNQFISLIFMIYLIFWYDMIFWFLFDFFYIKFLFFSIGFSFMFDGFGCLILWNRMMSDYKVEMINDGMQEFYVEFRGPSESNILYWLFSLISFYLSLVG